MANIPRKQNLLPVVIFLLPLLPTMEIVSCEDFESNIPGLRGRKNFYYIREGDLNIAHLTSVHQLNSSGHCTDLLTYGVVRSEALKLAVEKINSRSDILPNITLGFLSLDDCWNGQKALEVAVYLVTNFVTKTDSQSLLCSANASQSEGERSGDRKVLVGVLGPSNSPMSVSIAPFLGVFDIPIMSLYATSDDLSDKTRYEYFLRLVPPDSFQEQTLLEIVRRLGWSYLAMVYTEGAYGENAASQIDRFLRNGNFNICISVSVRIPIDANHGDYRNAIRRLMDNLNSRVVLTFLQGFQQEIFFSTVREMAGPGTFLFLSGDTLQQGEGESYADILEGSIYTDMPAYPIPGFLDYLSNLTPWNDAEDVWLSDAWESNFDCRLKGELSQLKLCTYTSKGFLSDIEWNWSLPSRTYDGVYVYALAIDRLLREQCPAAFRDKSLLADCIKGSKLLQYLKNSSTEGVNGKIRFNSNGDMIGDLVIRQYQRNPRDSKLFIYVEVGNWTSATKAIVLDMTKFSWTAFHRNKTDAAEVLESVCSKSCQVDEYAIKQDVSCCWSCVKCRDNEIVNQNSTGCQSCPLYTWPDRSNETSTPICSPIPPTYLRLENPISVTLIFFALAGVLTSMSVVVVYHVKRDHRLVKATSRELSLLILFGTLMASVVVVLFIVKPADGPCLCRSIGFHVAINLLYGPLLVKNIRTYRIFRAGQKSAKIPAGVGKNSQLIFVAVIACLEVVLISISEVLDPSVVALKMPTAYEMYVEIYCRKSVVWFLVPLASNISLMVLCAALGYATRRLPENFNESGFIFVSVATTLFAWLVFIPAYFSAVYAHLQSAILGFCLILNAFVTLGCQFLRMVYAVYFLAPERISFNATMTSVSGVSRVVTRVVPTDANVAKVSLSQDSLAPLGRNKAGLSSMESMSSSSTPKTTTSATPKESVKQGQVKVPCEVLSEETKLQTEECETGQGGGSNQSL